jgi:hypothetical protein
MAGKADKAAALFKSGADKAKAGGTKLYSFAKDPEMQAKAAKRLEDGKRMYRAATSPEAKQVYRQVAEFISKARKK